MKIYPKANVAEIRNQMERGSKILQQAIWTFNDTVNDKKALLCARSRPLELTLNADAAAPSMARPQNFHKKLDFPSFAD